MSEPTSFKDHFSGHAAAYAEARPGYPPELFAWLADEAPKRECAWDCATGNGQAARALAEHFARVIATDASAEQVANAHPHPRIAYRVAPAESPDLEPQSVDLVTVAQAVHWFDRPRFYAAARKALVPDGLIALWSYDLLTIVPAIDAVISNFYDGSLIGPYWPPERRLVDERYATLDFPFEEIAAPDFHMRQSWTLAQVLAYLGTWSGAQRYRRAEGRDPVATIVPELQRLWGDTPQREVSWPLYLRAGRVV
ncbi:MAG: class I SAM-dependent methyltransferase [Gammaproteobacteria bacterium]